MTITGLECSSESSHPMDVNTSRIVTIRDIFGEQNGSDSDSFNCVITNWLQFIITDIRLDSIACWLKRANWKEFYSNFSFTKFCRNSQERAAVQ